VDKAAEYLSLAGGVGDDEVDMGWNPNSYGELHCERYSVSIVYAVQTSLRAEEQDTARMSEQIISMGAQQLIPLVAASWATRRKVIFGTFLL